MSLTPSTTVIREVVIDDINWNAGNFTGRRMRAGARPCLDREYGPRQSQACDQKPLIHSTSVFTRLCVCCWYFQTSGDAFYAVDIRDFVYQALVTIRSRVLVNECVVKKDFIVGCFAILIHISF